jgi:putative DNA primase/helicase
MAFKLPKALEPIASLPIYVLWKLELRGDGTYTKPPFRVNDPTQYADPSDPNTWGSLEIAITALEQNKADGVGICLLRHGLAGFDLDHCIVNGKLDPAAARLIERAGSYVERSPSKTGLHILGVGFGPSLNRKQAVGSNGMSIESVRSAAKYFTLTGDEWPGSADTLANLDALLNEVVRKLDAQKERGGEGKPKPGRKRKLDLDDVIRNGRFDVFNNDRSRALWWVINELVRRGRDDSEILRILLDPNNRIGDHCRDHPQGAEACAKRQVQQARAAEVEKAGSADAIIGYGGFEDETALSFSAKHKNTLRYVHMWGKWYQWTGTHWEEETTLHAFHLARTLCRAGGDAKNKTVAAVASLARTDRRQAATTAQWDADPWLLGTPKGTIDLRTGKLSPPRPLNYITKTTSVLPGGKCDLWLTFLDRITASNKDLQAYLKRVLGYCLTGITHEDALFFLYGTGANGKSRFLNAIAYVLNDYHRAASTDMFTVSYGDRHPTDLAMLRGARAVTAIETEAGKRWDEVKLKTLTGGDPISARFMRQDFFTYIPQFKLLIAGNHKPGIRSVDEAIKRRMNLIPFTVTIPEPERDKQLLNKLKQEAPNILAWMIEGCLEWQRIGLKPPKIVTDATDQYLEAEDDLQTFIDECCVTAKNEYDTFAHLWDGWKDWAEDSGEYVGSKKRFGERLRERGFEAFRDSTGDTRSYKGLRCIRENARKQAAEAREWHEQWRAKNRGTPD